MISFKGRSNVYSLSKFRIVAKTKELRNFNSAMAEKSKEMQNKVISHCKILEKVQEDLAYIHQTIKMVEQLDAGNADPALPK